MAFDDSMALIDCWFFVRFTTPLPLGKPRSGEGNLTALF